MVRHTTDEPAASFDEAMIVDGIVCLGMIHDKSASGIARRAQLRVAAEHFAFYPDQGWQRAGTLAAYAG